MYYILSRSHNFNYKQKCGPILRSSPYVELTSTVGYDTRANNTNIWPGLAVLVSLLCVECFGIPGKFIGQPWRDKRGYVEVGNKCEALTLRCVGNSKIREAHTNYLSSQDRRQLHLTYIPSKPQSRLLNQGACVWRFLIEHGETWKPEIWRK